MAGGWASDGAEHEQIEATINDAIALAQRNLPQGKTLADSAEFCEECDAPIPLARRQAILGVQYCVNCQSKLESKQKTVELFNRRGSKDSQLR